MEHRPVLLAESLEGLSVRPDGIYVDGTLGRGGHSLEIVKRLDTGRLIAIDRDKDAIGEASEVLSRYKDKITFVHGNFGNISAILRELGEGPVDGMLFDFGVSSPQLDNPERGFSYMKDAPLDMRMDRQDNITAYEVVNSWPAEKLTSLFFEYGEERYARQITRAIVNRRVAESINTTFELNDIIISAIPAAARREAQHPSKRCFQALRIAVNDELGSIGAMLETAPSLLKTGGRLCVISFHSLEDRLVKNSFTTRASGCTCPKDFPICVCGGKPVLKIITKKPVTPSAGESEGNPRARSAKLRIAEKL